MDDIIKIDDAEYLTNYTKKYSLNRFSPPELEKTEVKAFIPGMVVDIFAEKGKKVKAGTVIMTFEAMKMINEVTLEHDITVKDVLVKKGDTFEKNQVLVKFKAIN
ncbi:MAG: acetyl-CoA carboxylase biotin carboxyl carrier protein subunit [Candidatus Delongbacteria bacterium]